MSRTKCPRFGRGFEKLEDRCTPAISRPVHFVVNTAQDTVDDNIGDGKALDANGNTSLRAVIDETNAAPLTGDWGTNRHLVTFAVPGGVITLTDLLPTLESNFEFQGANVTIERDPDSPAQFGLFTIGTETETHFVRVHMTGGRSPGHGGAVLNLGKVLLFECNLYGNQADATGGAIASRATATSLTIQYCSLWFNEAIAKGGAIAVFGATNLAISDTDIFSNEVTGVMAGQGWGGGVYVDTPDATVIPVLMDTRIFGNSTTLSGGGLCVVDTPLQMNGGEIHGNSAGDWGGGIYVDASERTVILTGVKLTNNSANVGGGAGVRNGTLRVESPVAFTGNTASVAQTEGGVWDTTFGTAAAMLTDAPPGSQQFVGYFPH